jgi:hypoxanthine phosphoribosyltransferase
MRQVTAGKTKIPEIRVFEFTCSMASVRFPKFVDQSEISEVVFTEDQIRQRVKELGVEISAAYKDIEKPLVLIGTLKGATPFFADLARELDVDTVWEFMSFSSYGMGTTSGAVQCVLDLKMDIAGRDVLIVEVSKSTACPIEKIIHCFFHSNDREKLSLRLSVQDILDTGNTLQYMLKNLKSRDPNSVKTVCFTHKVDPAP